MKKLMKKSSLLLAFALVFAGSSSQHPVIAVEVENSQKEDLENKSQATKKALGKVQEYREKIDFNSNTDMAKISNQIIDFCKTIKPLHTIVSDIRDVFGSLYGSNGTDSIDMTYAKWIESLRTAVDTIANEAITQTNNFIDENPNSTIADTMRNELDDLKSIQKLKNFFDAINSQGLNLNLSLSVENDDQEKVVLNKAIDDNRQLFQNIIIHICEKLARGSKIDLAVHNVSKIGAE